MASKSFYDILADQVRTDLRREIEAEIRGEMAKVGEMPPTAPTHIADRLGVWLSVNVTPQVFKTGAAPYRAYASRSPHNVDENKRNTFDSEPVRVAPKNVHELCALELIRRASGSRIGESLTEAELKSAWRRAALKCHPDRHIGAAHPVQLQQAAVFRELADAYETLSRLFEQLSDAA